MKPSSTLTGGHDFYVKRGVRQAQGDGAGWGCAPGREGQVQRPGGEGEMRATPGGGGSAGSREMTEGADVLEGLEGPAWCPSDRN